MPSDDYKHELRAQLDRASAADLDHVTILADELQNASSGSSGLTAIDPACETAMRAELVGGDTMLADGPVVAIRYALPRIHNRI